jgi:hypothetical protein
LGKGFFGVAVPKFDFVFARQPLAMAEPTFPLPIMAILYQISPQKHITKGLAVAF